MASYHGELSGGACSSTDGARVRHLLRLRRKRQAAAARTVCGVRCGGLPMGGSYAATATAATVALTTTSAFFFGDTSSSSSTSVATSVHAASSHSSKNKKSKSRSRSTQRGRAASVKKNASQRRKGRSRKRSRIRKLEQNGTSGRRTSDSANFSLSDGISGIFRDVVGVFESPFVVKKVERQMQKTSSQPSGDVIRNLLGDAAGGSGKKKDRKDPGWHLYATEDEKFAAESARRGRRLAKAKKFSPHRALRAAIAEVSSDSSVAKLLKTDEGRRALEAYNRLFPPTSSVERPFLGSSEDATLSEYGTDMATLTSAPMFLRLYPSQGTGNSRAAGRGVARSVADGLTGVQLRKPLSARARRNQAVSGLHLDRKTNRIVRHSQYGWEEVKIPVYEEHPEARRLREEALEAETQRQSIEADIEMRIANGEEISEESRARRLSVVPATAYSMAELENIMATAGPTAEMLYPGFVHERRGYTSETRIVRKLQGSLSSQAARQWALTNGVELRNGKDFLMFLMFDFRPEMGPKAAAYF